MKSTDDMKRFIEALNSIQDDTDNLDLNETDDLEDAMDSMFSESFSENKKNTQNKQGYSKQGHSKDQVEFLKNARDLMMAESPALSNNLKSLLLGQPSSSRDLVKSLLRSACAEKNMKIIAEVFFDRDILNRFFDARLPQEVLLFASNHGDADLARWVFSPSIRDLAETFSTLSAQECLKVACGRNSGDVLNILIDNAPEINPYLDLQELFVVAISKKALSSISTLCERFPGKFRLPDNIAFNFLDMNYISSDQKDKLVSDLMKFDKVSLLGHAHKQASEGSWDVAVRIASAASEEDYDFFVRAWKDSVPKQKNLSSLVSSFWDKAVLELSVAEQKNQKHVIGPRKM